MELKDYIVSIDLGCSKVVAALGALNEHGEVVVADFVSKPMSGFIRGEISNIELVTKALKSAVSELESRNNIIVSDVFVSVEGRHIVWADNSGFVYIGSDGEILEENVSQLCNNMNNVQAPDGMVILSRIPQRYKIDSRVVTADPVGMYGKQLGATYSFLLAGKGVLERISKAFDRVGISGHKFHSAACASAEVVASEDEKEMGVAVVDLGAGVTNVAIYHDNKLRYSVSIPVGQDAINKDIKAAAVPDKHIEKLKITHGYATASAIPFNILNSMIRIHGRTQHEKERFIPYRDLCTIIYARMLDITDYVVEAIRTSGYQTQLGAGIILTGGGSQLHGVVELFKDQTGQEVRLGIAEVGVGAESVEGCFDPSLATAIGLLAVGLKEGTVGGVKDAPQNSVESKGGDTNKNGGNKDEEPEGKGGRGGKGSKGGWFSTLIGRIDKAIFGPDQEIVDDENM